MGTDMSVNPTVSSRRLVVYFVLIIFSSELLEYHSKMSFRSSFGKKFGKKNTSCQTINELPLCVSLL